jgi:hypothetical protein
MLNGKYLQTRRLSKKLDVKPLGSGMVLKVHSPNVIKLESLSRWGIYNTFHESPIKPYDLSLTGSLLMIASEQNKLNKDMNGDQFPMGYKVEEILGILYSKE